jgi:hypothetical protein
MNSRDGFFTLGLGVRLQVIVVENWESRILIVEVEPICLGIDLL